MTELSNDATELLNKLPQSGRITNPTAIKLTGWDEERVRAAKYELRTAGHVDIKRGWGGPFGRLAKADESSIQKYPTAQLESELYEPLAGWVRTEFLPDDFEQDKDLFEVVVSANKRPTGAGAWEVPDLISLSLSKYAYVPQVLMELVCFEVKRAADAFNLNGIFEAISHSKFAHRAYYCFEWTDENFATRTDYQRIEEEAQAHGIGIVRLRFVDDTKTRVLADEIVESELLTPEPWALNGVVDRFFPDNVKKRILQRTGYNIVW